MDDEKILADVKLKQSDTEEPVPGTLCLTFEGIAFVSHKSNKKATFLLTHDKIKNHKHSEKGPLNFVLRDKDAGPTFEFERLPLRDLTRNVFEIFKALHRGVGDKLHPEQCMPDANEMDLRASALNADIHLKTLHDELVVAEILAEFEFWATTKTWLDLSSLKIPNAQTRSHTEGLSQIAGAHTGTTDTENSAIGKLADDTLEPEASPDSSKLKPSKETSEMESSVNTSETSVQESLKETSRLESSNETPELNPSQGISDLKSSKETSEVGSTQMESPEEKSETKLSGPDVEFQEKDAQSLADPSKTLQVISTDEPSGLSGDDDAKDSQALHFRRLEKQQMTAEKDILTRIGEADMNMEAKIYNVEAKLEAKIDKIEAKLETRIEEKIGGVEEKIGGVEEKIGGVEEKLESIGKMLAAFIAKQGMAAADSDNLEARRSEVTQIADASESALVAENLYQTKTILDLYPEEHHQKILQSGLPSKVKEELLFDNILADTLMVRFDTQKPHAGLFAFYKAGLLRNAMADVLEKLKIINESPEVMPLVNPIEKRLGAAISQFNEFVREERRKTNKRVKN